MKDSQFYWNGYPVIGDTKEFDQIIECQGMINLDLQALCKTLSATGVNYITVAKGKNIGKVFKEASSKLPVSIDEVSKFLIQFYVGTHQPIMSELSDIVSVLGKGNPEASVFWGISSDETLGDDFRVVLVSSINSRR